MTCSTRLLKRTSTASFRQSSPCMMTCSNRNAGIQTSLHLASHRADRQQTRAGSKSSHQSRNRTHLPSSPSVSAFSAFRHPRRTTRWNARNAQLTYAQQALERYALIFGHNPPAGNSLIVGLLSGRGVAEDHRATFRRDPVGTTAHAT